MYLGKLKRNEEIPLTVVFSATVTGTPQYRILESDHTAHVALANLTQDGATPVWYKAGQAVGGSDAVGMYKVEYVGVVSAVNEYYYDVYEVTINDIDDVKAETALILTDTGNIEDKVDIIDGIVDSILVDTTALLVDTTSIESKVDIIDTNVDTLLVDTGLIKGYTVNLEGKIDTIDGIVDAILVDTTAILVDTGNIEDKVDVIDGIVDNIYVDTQAILADLVTLQSDVTDVKAQTDKMTFNDELEIISRISGALIDDNYDKDVPEEDYP